MATQQPDQLTRPDPPGGSTIRHAIFNVLVEHHNHYMTTGEIWETIRRRQDAGETVVAGRQLDLATVANALISAYKKGQGVLERSNIGARQMGYRLKKEDYQRLLEIKHASVPAAAPLPPHPATPTGTTTLTATIAGKLRPVVPSMGGPVSLTSRETLKLSSASTDSPAYTMLLQESAEVPLDSNTTAKEPAPTPYLNDFNAAVCLDGTLILQLDGQTIRISNEGRKTLARFLLKYQY